MSEKEMKFGQSGGKEWRGALIPAAMICASLAVPLLSWIAGMTGRELVLYQRAAHNELTAAAMLGLALLSMVKGVRMNRFGQICAMIALPAAIVGGFDLLARAEDIVDFLCAPVCMAAAVCVYARHAVKGRTMRALVGVLSGVMGAALLIWTLLTALMADFGESYAAVSAPSPDGRLVASIWYVDQGALGGDMFLEVRERGSDINVLIGKMRRYRRYPLDLPGVEPAGRVIEWVDRETVSIDGMEYDVSGR